MALRDPGNAPASGDRIPFVYVRPEIGKTAAKLQGDRIEAPTWIKEKGLTPDYEFYLTNQLQNPISQMFGLILEEMPGSDKISWSKAPEDPEKRQLWRESQAALILFEKALQACTIHHKGAFVQKFFGTTLASATTTDIKDTKHTTIAKPRSMNKTPPTKPKQTTLNSFMLDNFLVKTITKTQQAKKRALKKDQEAKEEQSLKNEVIQQ
jgi:hypothetical protein